MECIEKEITDISTKEMRAYKELCKEESIMDREIELMMERINSPTWTKRFNDKLIILKTSSPAMKNKK